MAERIEVYRNLSARYVTELNALRTNITQTEIDIAGLEAQLAEKRKTLDALNYDRDQTLTQLGTVNTLVRQMEDAMVERARIVEDRKNAEI
jgi:uncharacterized coiled-coil protein SlyX